jgi:predicted RND superfamily exporter protein
VSRFAAWVTAHPLLTLAVIAAITVFALTRIVDVRHGELRLKIDPSYDRFVPEGTEERAFYEDMIRRFGNDEMLTVAVIADDVFSPDVLPRIARMTRRFKSLEGVRDVVSLSTALNIKGHEGELLIEPFYTGLSDDPEELHRLRDEALANPIYSGNLVAKNGMATALLVILQDMTEYEFSQAGIDQKLEQIADEERGPVRVWITGPSRIKAETTRTVLRDIALVMPAAYAAIALIAFLSFRTIRGVLVPSITVGIALVWTLALMVVSGRSVNLVTTIVPPLILTVGFAYTVHVISAYGVALREHPHDPVRHALEEVLLPLLLTALTTCVGLLALMISPLGAIREFGLFASVGVAATVAVSVTFAPAVLQLLPPPKRVLEESRGTIDRWLERIGRFDLRHRNAILAVGLLASVLAIWGATRIHVSNDLISMFADEHPVHRSYVAINERLDGANPFYVVLTSEMRDTFKQPSNLAVVEELADWIEVQEGIGSVTSLVDYLKIIHWGFRDNDPAFMTIPETAALTDQLLFFGGNEELEAFVDSRYQITRILVRAQVIDSADLGAILKHIRERLTRLPEHIQGRVSGSTVLVSEASDDIARGQAQSILIAMFAIYLILAALFTSFQIGFVALIPNIVPVLVYFGALGWFEIPLNTTTGLAACVALGIAVDDSIHYITRFSVRAKERADVQRGTVEALVDVGRPVTYTTMALCAGFLMIPIAELRNQTYFGLLAAFTLFVAWLVDMTLTPALCSRLRIVTLWEVITLDLGPDPQHSIPLLEGLSRRQARVVALMTDMRTFPDGHVLFREGEAGEDMYVVVDGELRIWIHDEGDGTRELRRLHRGDVVGEIAPFLGKRTANVTTVGQARLLRITLKDLEELRRRYPKVGATVYRNLARVVAGRVGSTMEQLR